MYTQNDKTLADLLPHMSFHGGLAFDDLPMAKAEVLEVYHPCEEFAFTHECAVMPFHGSLFAAWYNNRRTELRGETPIRWRVSRDGGRSWGAIRTLVTDPTEEILYCPPVFAVDEDRLYMLINEMYRLPDHIHALDLYVYNEETDAFDMLWSRPIPFKLNTNALRLANGKLMLPGRIAEPDGFPNTPAVLISDSGRVDAEWRLVYIAENGDLPDGSRLVHPEITPIQDGRDVYMFCRDDERQVPLVYLSRDEGETWTGPFAHDIPLAGSKIYSGTLRDGRHYLIGNLAPDRRRLAVFLSRGNDLEFTQGCLLQSGFNAELGCAGTQWSYPVAEEWNGKLYVIYTAAWDENQTVRGAMLSVMDL